MINRVVQFLSFIFLGAIFGLLCFIVGDQMGLFIQKWRPDFTLIDRNGLPGQRNDQDFVQISNQPEFINPVQAAITPKVYQTVWTEMRPEISSVPLDVTQTLQVILSGYPFDTMVFVEKLDQLAAKSKICPESKLTSWSDCFGVYEFPWGDRYKGTWDGDKINGFGQIIKKNGDQYIGDFVNNKSEGCGIYVFSDGETVSGFWKAGDLIQEQKQCRRL
ncbi:MAG: hypothetical protein ACPGNR_10265 [Paracoccaceae bacterium]